MHALAGQLERDLRTSLVAGRMARAIAGDLQHLVPCLDLVLGLFAEKGPRQHDRTNPWSTRRMNSDELGAQDEPDRLSDRRAGRPGRHAQNLPEHLDLSRVAI